jgi:hypothetical protein
MTRSRLGDSYDPLGRHLDDPCPLYEQARLSEPVGAALARAEARTALQVLTELLPHPRLVPDQPLPRQTSVNLRGPQSMELVW